jgi:hypothetical protein
MDSQIAYYVFVLIAIAVGVIVIKKVASCLIKSIVTLVLVGLVVYLYFALFK